MPGIGLLDCDDVEHARAARFMAPDTLYAAQPRALDLVPDHPGLHHALAVGEIRRRAHRRGHGQYRLLAGRDSPHPGHQWFSFFPGVEAAETAQTALRART